MEFKYPAALYFLFVLIIPILIHLFNLKKFKKIEFTNVQFLKQISIETRKSSKLKKLLILATRLLSLIALIFSFSQPYFGSKKTDKNRQFYIYLENSESLNTNGNQGNLLKIAVQDIIENSPENGKYFLLTNDDFKLDISKKQLNNTLKNIKISNKNTSIEDKINTIQTEIYNKSKDWKEAFKIYSKQRKPDGDALQDLSLDNYYVMSADVADENFLLQKKIEARIHERHPEKWMPLYSQVTFSHIPYSEAYAQGKKQDKIMKEVLKDPNIKNNWDSVEIEEKILSLI